MGGQAPHLLPEQVSRLDVQRCGGLVEEEQVGVAGDGQGEVEPLLLPAGELADPATALLEQVGTGQDVVQAQRERVVVAHQVDGFGNGEALGSAAFLEHRADPSTGGLGVGSVSEDSDLPGRRGAQPEQHLDGRRLPGAVGAKDRDNVAGADNQVEGIDGQELPVSLGEAAGSDHGRPCR